VDVDEVAGQYFTRRGAHSRDGRCGAATALLRLPTGIFYAQGVKEDVLFFDRKPASETPWTKTLWIDDLRTKRHFIQDQHAPAGRPR
jgi:hypothetical protein